MANPFDRDVTSFIQGMQRQSEFVQQAITFEQVNHIATVVDRMEKEQKKIKRDLALQPMRVYNFSANKHPMGPNGPLSFHHTDGSLLTVGSVQNISESEADALAQELHLPPFEKDTPLQKKRERIMKYLGFIAGFEDEPDDENVPSEEEEFEDDNGEVIGYDDDWSDHRLD